MSKKLFFVGCIISFCLFQGISQNETRSTTTNVVLDGDTVATQSMDISEAFQYKAKPSDAWELGVHVGHFFIDGDVDHGFPGGYGLGLHLRKAIHYAFSVRLDLFYGKASGLDPQPSGANLLPEQNVFSEYGPDNPWFYAYKTRYVYGAIEGILNIGNILFHKEQNVWNLYAGIGIGLDNNKTMLDLRDESGQVYSNLVSQSGFTSSKFDTKSGRGEIKDALSTVYDGDYETEGPRKKGIFRLGDDTNIHPVFTGSVGIARKINRRFNLGLEHKLILSDNDYLDGQKWRSGVDQTNNVDVAHYTALRLAINLGDLSKKTEPLFWLNPIDATINEVISLTQELNFRDDDGDGVVNLIDQELKTEAGCPVDTRGVTLDSDKDGIPDCKDCEPYSLPGFKMSDCGAAIVEVVPDHDHPLSKDAVIAILNEECEGCHTVQSECGEWFLPMINFDLDKYDIKPEFYSHLHHVATVMEICPDICVVAYGHTDSRHSNDYNDVLSYKRAKQAIDYLVNNYGIDRSRLKLRYGGEASPMVKGLNDAPSSSQLNEKKHYMNRRVEFRLCKSGDVDMEMPEGPDAGKSSKPKGDKDSGY